MKNIITLPLLLVVSFYAAQGIHFKKEKYHELLAMAKKENKLVFIDAYAAWCGPCKIMSKSVFTQKKVGDYYNQNFINAKIDMEKGEGRDIAKKFRVFSYPTYLFINGDGRLISMNRGYIEAENFIALGKEVQSAFTDGDRLKTQFKNGELQDAEGLKKIIKMYAATDFPLSKMASEMYFKNKKDAFSQEDINYLIPFIKGKNDENFKYFETHKDEIIKVFPEKNYNAIREQVLVSEILMQHHNTQTETIDNEEKTLTELTEILGETKAKEVFTRYQLMVYQNSNPSKFIDIALKYYEDKKHYNPKEIMQVSWIIGEKSNHQAALTTASQWMEEIVMKQETSENTYILAKLYSKLGKKTEAKMFAKVAIDLAKGKKMILAEQLLERLK